jgi:glucose dehydrogenase
MKVRFATGLGLLALCCATIIGAQAAHDWVATIGDRGGMKFSALTQITPQNVSQLTQAWSFDFGSSSGGRMEFTPIVIGDVMYFPTTDGKIVAIKADSGSALWKFDLRQLGPSTSASDKGISYWPGDANAAPRIVVATNDGQLVQLEAETGSLVPDVGDIKLGVGIADKFGGAYATNMPPTIYKNLAIIAAETGEGGRWGTPGDPRGFDLLTGKELWRFHIVPQPGEENFGTWGDEGWQDRKCCGVWVSPAIDTVNGIVYIPTGNATDQDFGSTRPGTNLYSASIVALDANTGKLKWYYQQTHHDITDQDTNSPPMLIDINKDGQQIPAIVQMTKMGWLYILNRLTGKPIFDIPETPVPPTDALGDQAWPTQPIPIVPPPLARVSMSRSEVAKLTPDSEKYCLDLYDKSVNMGPHTPYLMVPSLVFPASEGGGGWAGEAFDPGRQLIFANVRNVGLIGQLQPSTTQGLPSFSKSKIPTAYYTDPNGYPCNAPPWAELFAINAETGAIVWHVPLGEYKELTAQGMPQTGTPTDEGGPMATATGLVFIAGTADQTIRAFDAATGKQLWAGNLPEDALNTPLTYQGADGRQYIAVLAAAGHPEWDHPRPTSTMSARIVAFALPTATSAH